MVNFTCWKHSWIISPNGWDRKKELSSKYTKIFEITLMRDSKRNRLIHRLWSAAKLNSSAVSCSKFCVLHIINNICLNSNNESDTVRLLKYLEKIGESFISNFSSKIRKKIGSKRDNKKKSFGLNVGLTCQRCSSKDSPTLQCTGPNESQCFEQKGHIFVQQSIYHAK